MRTSLTVRSLRAILALAPLFLIARAVPAQTPPAAQPAKPVVQAKPAASPVTSPTASPTASPKTIAATAADPVVLTVGMEKITKSQFEAIFSQVTSQMPPDRKAAMQAPDAKRNMAEQLAELKALAQEARRQKLDQAPEAKTQLSMRADQFMAGLLYQNIAKSSKPDDAAIQAYYDAHKGEYESVTARHILIRMKGSAVPLKDGQEDLTEEQALAKAQDLKAKLTAGGSFEELAKANSDDTGSGANGGALGDFTRGRMVPPFEEAAFKLKVDEISDPVKTQFGYHIIQVTKHEAKALTDVRPEIEQKLEPEATQKGVDAIKSKTTITYDQGFFGK